MAEGVPGGGASLERAEQHAGLVEVRSASRLGFVGVWVRRLVQRFTRFQWLHQGEYNRALIEAQREQQVALAQVAAHLQQITATLEAVVERSLPALGSQLGAVSGTVEQVVAHSLPSLGAQVGAVSGTVQQIVGESLPSLGQQVGAVSGTVEQIVTRSLPSLGEQVGDVSHTVERIVERSIPQLGEQLAAVADTVERLVGEGVPAVADHVALVSRTVQELQAAHGRLYETSRAHGRHLDDLATRVADFGETIEEAAERESGFAERLIAETDKLGAAVADFETRLRPNLHFDSFDFARKHRGSEEELIRRLAKYAVAFGPVARVLDVGCGRGEFLQACREAGVGAYGIETDPDMVSRCRMKALEVVQADVLEHLRSLEDRSLDGIFMAQVIEHLTPSEIVDFVRLAADKMRRGGKIIVETINPDTFSALRWFWMDPTHRQPVSEATLRFLLEDAGFTLADVLYSSPVPEEETLQRLPESFFGAAGPGAAEAVRAYNRNVERLNRILFGDQDYAVVAER
jgi:O-antigen chain-terminating methyltransferase